MTSILSEASGTNDQTSVIKGNLTQGSSEDSFIRGGRANVCYALYMPALVAARFNPDLKEKYQQLITAGKPVKIVITAIMRKLIVTAKTLLKADHLWVKSRLTITDTLKFIFHASTERPGRL